MSSPSDIRSALIGYTGFVGSNLGRSADFTDYFNTSNIAELRHRSYDLVVSAASRADSHRINRNGAADRAEIDEYLDILTTVSATKIVFISTVCIYPEATAPDESTPLSEDGLTPYGANRLHLERVLTERFDTLAVRLPQLYGHGLKKGIVYDLLNDYRVEFIRPEAEFQYYDLTRLWDDTQRALEAGLSALNIATPPLSSAQVAAECFEIDLSLQVVPGPKPIRGYTSDMRTQHAALFGGPPGYLMTHDAELDALRDFVRHSRQSERSDRDETGSSAQGRS